MPEVTTNRGRFSANTQADVRQLLDAGLISEAQALRLLSEIASDERTQRDSGLGSLQDQAAASAAAEGGFTSALDQLTQSARAETADLNAPPASSTPTVPTGVGDFRDPRIEFLERRGVGPGRIPVSSAAGQSIGSEFVPLQQLFAIQQAVNRAVGGTDVGAETIGEFTQQFPDRASRSARGSQILSNFFGLTPAQRSAQGLSFEQRFDAEGRDITAQFGVEPLSFLQDLLGQGTRSSRGPRGSTSIASRVPATREAFKIERPDQDFVSFLKERLGLTDF